MSHPCPRPVDTGCIRNGDDDVGGRARVTRDEEQVLQGDCRRYKCCCPWFLAVLKDSISVLGPGLGLGDLVLGPVLSSEA